MFREICKALHLDFRYIMQEGSRPDYRVQAY